MALCGRSADCGCAFFSNSLVLSGSGDRTNPLILETYEGTVTDESEIASPFLGQRIYETSTDRLKIYDGTSWIIYGGNWPRFSAYTSAAQSIPNNTLTTMSLTEVYDTDGIHSAGVATVPAGLGGEWQVILRGHWGTWDADGVRLLAVTITDNTSNPNEPTGLRASDGPSTVSTEMSMGSTDVIRLEAGAVLTAQAFHVAGAALDLSQRRFAMRMVKHIPTLT